MGRFSPSPRRQSEREPEQHRGHQDQHDLLRIPRVKNAGSVGIAPTDASIKGVLYYFPSSTGAPVTLKKLGDFDFSGLTNPGSILADFQNLVVTAPLAFSIDDALGDYYLACSIGTDDLPLVDPKSALDGASTAQEWHDFFKNNANTACRKITIAEVGQIIPQFYTLNPASNSHVKTMAAGYALTFTIASGTVTWERTSGTVDLGSSHVHSLSESELAAGSHGDIMVSGLVDGAVYSIRFEGVDTKGPSRGTMSPNSSSRIRPPISPAIRSADSPCYSPEALSRRFPRHHRRAENDLLAFSQLGDIIIFITNGPALVAGRSS
jgi:hypothetical protein